MDQLIDPIAIACIAIGALLIGFVIGLIASRNRIHTMESKLSNSSAVLNSYITAATAALKAKDDEIAALKAEIASSPDLTADEQAIASATSALQAAGIALPVEPVAAVAEPVVAVAA